MVGGASSVPYFLFLKLEELKKVAPNRIMDLGPHYS